MRHMPKEFWLDIYKYKPANVLNLPLDRNRVNDKVRAFARDSLLANWRK